MRKMAAIIGLVVSGVMILLGVLVQTGAILDFDGDTAIYASFGPDFYTYSYRATRYAANNVDELGEFAQGALGLVLVLAGAAGVALSRYGMVAAQESEEQRELMRAILRKMNQAEKPAAKPEIKAPVEKPVAPVRDAPVTPVAPKPVASKPVPTVTPVVKPTKIINAPPVAIPSNLSPEEMKPWTCTYCGASNAFHRKFCHRCEEDRQ